jgi:hypothetical protein
MMTNFKDTLYRQYYSKANGVKSKFKHSKYISQNQYEYQNQQHSKNTAFKLNTVADRHAFKIERLLQ